MTIFSNSPRLFNGGIMLIDPNTSDVKRNIALQYNSNIGTRILQAQSIDEVNGRSSIPAEKVNRWNKRYLS